MNIEIFTTGGTIDKIYFDALSEFSVGETKIGDILSEANVGFDYQVTRLLKKDSLELTDEDRDVIFEAVHKSDALHILITHGTDTMVQTAQKLLDIEGKTIVLTGAMQPASLRSTDAVFNIGFALGALQHLSEGVHIAMNGKVFDPATTVKDRKAQMFKAG